MESTLARDLYGLSLLYEWAETVLKIDLDLMLERGELPCGRGLESLIAFLRQTGKSRRADVTSMATTALHAVAVRSFLSWVADPMNQGSDQRKPVQRVAEERAMLSAVFRRIERYRATTKRIRPPSHLELERLWALFGPRRDESGRIVVPVQFHERNPFWPENQLRNWLMMIVAFQCGLRRGELLKARIDDLPRSTDNGLKVRRRPHDAADSRRYKPRVKTVERILPLSMEVRIGLRAYLSGSPPLGRPAGRTPYLFVTSSGAPLSIPAADEIPKVVSRHAEIPDLSWHSFRHGWAESLAEDLLDRYPQEHAFGIIRELGGWRRNSSTPMHYIQNAVRKRGVAFLVERNSRLYGSEDDQ